MSEELTRKSANVMEPDRSKLRNVPAWRSRRTTNDVMADSNPMGTLTKNTADQSAFSRIKPPKTIAAIIEALDGLEEIGARGQLPVVLMGGVKNGVDAVKALCLGATAVGLGTSMLLAGGCIACMQCSVGSCPVGLATQDPDHVQRLDTEKRALMIHRYLEAIRWQIASLTSELGYSDVRQLSRDDLVALTPEAAELTRLPYHPEYREEIRKSLDEQGAM